MSLFKFPFTFVAGTKAKAEEVNKNFEAAEEEINDNLRPGTHESGDLKATARAAAPEGWLMCEGQAISRTSYADLFGAIGTTYGAGDKATTFNVPDLRGRVAVGADGAAGRLSANDSLGNSGGEEKHQLSEAELAAHHHHSSFNTSGRGSFHQHSLPLAFDNTFQGGGSKIGAHEGSAISAGSDSPDHVHAVDGDTDSRGGNAAHNNMPPFQVVNWLIKV